MRNDITYEDKLAYITSYMVQHTNEFQVKLLEEIPDGWTISRQVDYLYERITQGVEMSASQVRFNESKQAS